MGFNDFLTGFAKTAPSGINSALQISNTRAQQDFTRMLALIQLGPTLEARRSAFDKEISTSQKEFNEGKIDAHELNTRITNAKAGKAKVPDISKALSGIAGNLTGQQTQAPQGPSVAGRIGNFIKSKFKLDRPEILDNTPSPTGGGAATPSQPAQETQPVQPQGVNPQPVPLNTSVNQILQGLTIGANQGVVNPQSPNITTDTTRSTVSTQRSLADSPASVDIAIPEGITDPDVIKSIRAKHSLKQEEKAEQVETGKKLGESISESIKSQGRSPATQARGQIVGKILDSGTPLDQAQVSSLVSSAVGGREKEVNLDKLTSGTTFLNEVPTALTLLGSGVTGKTAGFTKFIAETDSVREALKSTGVGQKAQQFSEVEASLNTINDQFQKFDGTTDTTKERLTDIGFGSKANSERIVNLHKTTIQNIQQEISKALDITPETVLEKFGDLELKPIEATEQLIQDIGQDTINELNAQRAEFNSVFKTQIERSRGITQGGNDTIAPQNASQAPVDISDVTKNDIEVLANTLDQLGESALDDPVFNDPRNAAIREQALMLLRERRLLEQEEHDKLSRPISTQTQEERQSLPANEPIPGVNFTPGNQSFEGGPVTLPEPFSFGGANRTLDAQLNLGKQNIEKETEGLKNVLKEFVFGRQKVDDGIFVVVGYDENGRPIHKKVGDIMSQQVQQAMSQGIQVPGITGGQ